MPAKRGGVPMKRNQLLAVAVISLCVLPGCSSREEITLPFSASDVHFVEMYRYTVPADAQTKVVVEAEDIESLWEDCDSEAVEVHESKLPGDPCGLTTKPIEGTMLLPGHYVAEGYDLYMEPCLDLHADRSAEIPQLDENTLKDGARFVYQEEK